MSQDNNIQLDKDIFAALIDKHEVQRDLCDKLEKETDNDKRNTIYQELKLELQAHAAAEERHLYIPVMQHDDGLDLSRHAITEHHEMDEMMETLGDGRISQETWDNTCADLIHKVRHHLKEEENEFFKQARKILDDDLQQRLGALYQVEHDEFMQKHEAE
ncbi:hemerythrin domain-containing protein [Psychrobacter sp. FDAARGOS_221]|uniref:hemerythrin domain-containing protein n=1 Tax=Psychrobacter sp. FDAARGOS_221 TaxID=1975705 RepID=UPI000BB59128|nr:hemerythrin domain-containing protein [Psychrobacter sp. FDAARGOS_221]PNK60412.1 hemerythrin domain-containing protein [Psychrobacter sp. FDAARGOS_221]